MLIKFNHDFYLNTDRIEAIQFTTYTDEQIKAKQGENENESKQTSSNITDTKVI